MPVFSNVVPKLILHKFKNNSAVYALLHNYSRTVDGNLWEARFDLSDQEYSNESFLKYIKSCDSGIIPYTNWFFPAFVNISQTSARPVAQQSSGTDQAYVADKVREKEFNPLSWKGLFDYRTHNEQLKTILTRYRDLMRDALIAALQKGKDSVQETDITGVLTNYTHSTSIEALENTLVLDVTTDPQGIGTYGERESVPVTTASMSNAEFNSGIGGTTVTNDGVAALPIIEENDIIELRVKYVSSDSPSRTVYSEGMYVDDDGFERVFIGPVTNISKSLRYGRNEQATLQCNGISKLLGLSRSAYVPSLQSNADNFTVQGVELTEPGITFLQNSFSDKTAGDVFKKLLKDTIGYVDEYSPKDVIADDRLLSVAAKPAKATADTFFGSFTVPALPSEIVSAFDFSSSLKITPSVMFPAAIKIPDSFFSSQEGLSSLDLTFLSASPSSAAAALTAEQKALFHFVHHVPALHILARHQTGKYEALSDVLASVELGRSPAMQLLLARSISLFYPELKTPEEILNSIKSTAYLEIYDDRPGVIRMRPPKYNTLNLNPEPVIDFVTQEDGQNSSAVDDTVTLALQSGKSYNLNKRFTIDPGDILDYSIVRHDEALQTRSDHELMMPMYGAPMNGYSVGHYTDPTGLIRYGLRTAGLVQNPMCQTPELGGVLSAVHLAYLNRNTRAITINVRNSREFRMGQLYFIPVITKSAPADTKKAFQDSNTDAPVDQNNIRVSELVNNLASVSFKGTDVEGAATAPVPANETAAAPVIQGIVGYLSRVTTFAGYNAPPTHQLSLNYVRVADVIEYEGKLYANYKKLPDIQTALEMMQADETAKHVADKLRDQINTDSGSKNPSLKTASKLASASSEGYLTLDNLGGRFADRAPAPIRTEINRSISDNKSAQAKVPDDVVAECGTFKTPVQKTTDPVMSNLALAGVTLATLDPYNGYNGYKVETPYTYRLTRSFRNRNIRTLLQFLGDACMHFIKDGSPFVGVNKAKLKWEVSERATLSDSGLTVTGNNGQGSSFKFGLSSSTSSRTADIIVGRITLRRNSTEVRRVLALPVPDANTCDLANIINTGLISRVNNSLVAHTFSIETLTIDEILTALMEFPVSSDASDPGRALIDWGTEACDDLYYKAVTLLDAYHQPNALSLIAGKSYVTGAGSVDIADAVVGNIDWKTILSNRDATATEMWTALTALGVSPQQTQYRIASSAPGIADKTSSRETTPWSFSEYLRSRAAAMSDILIYVPFKANERPFNTGISLLAPKISDNGRVETKTLFDIQYCTSGVMSGNAYAPRWSVAPYTQINASTGAPHAYLSCPSGVCVLEALDHMTVSTTASFFREFSTSGTRGPLNIIAVEDVPTKFKATMAPMSMLWYYRNAQLPSGKTSFNSGKRNALNLTPIS